MQEHHPLQTILEVFLAGADAVGRHVRQDCSLFVDDTVGLVEEGTELVEFGVVTRVDRTLVVRGEVRAVVARLVKPNTHLVVVRTVLLLFLTREAVWTMNKWGTVINIKPHPGL